MWPRQVDEYINAHECHAHEIIKVLAQGRSAVQSFEIAELGNYGASMIIEGRVQSTEHDEYIYHEALIYPSYSLHPRLSRVLCLGGANGGMLRELCKLPDIEDVTIADIDPELYEASKIHLPHMHRGAHNDPRCTMLFGDPRRVLATLAGPFDAVYADLPDAVSGTNTASLFTQEFYHDIKRRLSADGLYVTQAGPAHHRDCAFFASVLRTLESVFRHAVPYSIAVPSFGVPWGFVIASDGLDPSGWEAIDMPGKMAQLAGDDLRSYDPISHRHMFSLPKQLRTALASAGRIINDGDKLYVESGPESSRG
jgi:spermidine synthase